MAELFLVVSLALFAAGCVGLCIVQNRDYKARHDQTEDDKTDRIAKLNSDIERASRGELSWKDIENQTSKGK